MYFILYSRIKYIYLSYFWDYIETCIKLLVFWQLLCFKLKPFLILFNFFFNLNFELSTQKKSQHIKKGEDITITNKKKKIFLVTNF